MSRNYWGPIAAVVVVVGFLSAVFTVHEGKQALLFQAGHLKMQQDNKPVILMPGLHVKLPFFEQARQFDMRIQMLHLTVPTQLNHSGLEGTADYIVNWKIENLPLFYQRTGGNLQQANLLLTQSLTGHLNLAPNQWQSNEANQQAMALGAQLGVRIISVQYKGVVLSKNALTTTYQVMRDAQAQQAKNLRIEGKLQADKIISDAEARSAVVIAQAQANASQLKAQGDAKAAKIYADAYSKEPEFYTFLINLEAYANTFNNKQDVIVLTPATQFLNYFNWPQRNQQLEKMTIKGNPA